MTGTTDIAGPSVRNVSLSPLRSIPVFYRMLLRGQVTRGRAGALGVLGALIIGLTLVVSNGTSATDESMQLSTLEVIAQFGLGIMVPLAAVLLATPMLGNLFEDRVLAYLWLKPVARWHLAVAALLAVLSVLVPAVVLPIVIAAAVSGFPSLIAPLFLASLLGALAYGALYLFFGARFSWGLWLSLLYLVLWENVLSRLTSGLARVSIRSYLQTVASWSIDGEIPTETQGDVAAVVVPLAVAIVALALTAWTLAKRDID